MGYETLTLLQGNVTAAQTITAVGSLFVLAGIGFGIYVLYKYWKAFADDWMRRTKASTYYCMTVNAYKTGLIKKLAVENDVELIYNVEDQPDDLATAIDKQVREDISKA